jgi:hypothetical protein
LRSSLTRLLSILVITVLAVAGWQVAGRDGRTVLKPVSGPILTTATALGAALTPAAPGAELIGPDAGVQLLSYGFVPDYRSGQSSRAAPAGHRLIAFAARPLSSEDPANPADPAESIDPPAVSLRVGADESAPLALTAGYVVASVPLAPTSIDLVLSDGGVKQSISLLTGELSPGNPVVCSRLNRVATVGTSAAVSIKVQPTGRAAGLTTGSVTLRTVSLSYWAADGSHASASDRALLHVGAVVKLAGDTSGYGAEAGLLSLSSVTSAISSAPARNAAPHPSTEVDDVIEVPADLTTGVIHYAGTIKAPSGEIWVMNPVSIPFTIPAG